MWGHRAFGKKRTSIHKDYHCRCSALWDVCLSSSFAIGCGSDLMTKGWCEDLCSPDDREIPLQCTGLHLDHTLTWLRERGQLSHLPILESQERDSGGSTLHGLLKGNSAAQATLLPRVSWNAALPQPTPHLQGCQWTPAGHHLQTPPRIIPRQLTKPGSALPETVWKVEDGLYHCI